MKILKSIFRGIGMTLGGAVFILLMLGAYQSRLDTAVNVPLWFDVACFLFLSFAIGKLLYANIKYEEIMKEKGEGEEMKLEKFPVVTNRQEYKVEVAEKEDYLFGKYLVATVYLLGKSKFFKIDKWNIVNEYFVERDYEEYIGRYVELAKKAVMDYEEWLEEQEARESAHSKGLNEWSNWDGKVN